MPNIIGAFKQYLRTKGPIYIIRTICKEILPGYGVFKSLQRKYGKDVSIFVGQHPGTGDVYLQSMFLKEYISSHQITKYVFTVIGKGAQNVAKLFNIEHIEIISIEKSNQLIKFRKFVYGECDLKINVLHYHAMASYYDEYMGNLRNYRGLNFMEMMKRAVFKEGNFVVTRPKPQPDYQYINCIYKKYSLLPQKTVLIAPYANSVSTLPASFWEHLAKRLDQLGYRVCTNSFGLNEPPIQGTCAVALSYNDIYEFLKRSGYLICLRSGLCDLISSVECKKIILYPRQELSSIMGGLGTVYNYFSLNKMGLCNDAMEFEFSVKANEHELELIENAILRALHPKLCGNLQQGVE